jgi:spore coat protein A, manganese oxidase
MSVTRRQFIKTTAGAAAAIAAYKWDMRSAYAFSWTGPLQKFIQPLQGLGPAGVPTATPDRLSYPGVDYYQIKAGVFRQQLHPSLPVAGTRLYGYADLSGAHRHLGGLIVAEKGTPVRINFTNNLPAAHILPFDPTVPMTDSQRQDRAAIHLHGGLVPWASDGGPFHWIANSANVGGAAVGTSLVGGNWLKDAAGNPTYDYWYPNNQGSRLMWYHDHALGITRINAYAGVATGYLLRETALETTLGLADPGIPLVFQDKVFWDPLVDPLYSNYVPGVQAGDLWYPYLYEKARWKVANAKKALPPPVPSCIPEFFGDTMLVNGTVYPYVQVQKGKYRFRLLNACNARFLSLQFVMEDPLIPGEPALVKGLPVPANVNVWQIGTEGGFLPVPAQLFAAGLPGPGAPLAPNPPFLVTTAERPDIIVDFVNVPAGSKVLLYNDAPAPYPAGSPLNDWFFGSNKTPVPTTAGNGPNTRTILQFQVLAGVPSQSPTVPASIPVAVLPTTADAVNGGLKLNITGSSCTFNGATYLVLPNTQELTLNEVFDAYGRLEQRVGTTTAAVGGGFGTPYIGSAPQTAQYGSIQIWNIYNLTADAHPMHFHLFNVMVLRRRPFNVANFTGIPAWTGLGVGPDANETGWKETVRMMPGTCTTVAILVEHPLPGRTVAVTPTVTATLPTSPRTGNDEYVWHCHILEHEEHDMMHALVAS